MKKLNDEGIDLKYILGLDLGQANDPTGLVILERSQSWTMDTVPVEEKDRYVITKWREREKVSDPIYKARHVERLKLGTPYPEVVDYVKTLINREEIGGNYGLVIDMTGVGRPVFDIAKKAGLDAVGVTITGGDTVSWQSSRTARVSKRILVGTVTAVMQTGRLRLAKDMDGVDALQKELLDFRVKVTDSANDIYSAREGAHDDLVLSLALALWIGENYIKRPKKASMHRY